MMYGPMAHSFGLVFLGFAWVISSLILIAVTAALIFLLVRFLWFGTKASQRYLELNGQPTSRLRRDPIAAGAPVTVAEPEPAPAPPLGPRAVVKSGAKTPKTPRKPSSL